VLALNLERLECSDNHIINGEEEWDGGDGSLLLSPAWAETVYG